MKVSTAEKNTLAYARDQALAAQEKAATECSRKQEEVDHLAKEKEDIEVRERTVIEERDAALKQLSKMEKKISALSEDLRVENEQSSLFKGLHGWTITETAKKMISTLTDTRDGDTIDINEVISRFEEGRNEVLSREAYLKVRGATPSSVPPQDP